MPSDVATSEVNAQWARLCAEPDEAAFAAVFDRHRKAVHNYCFRHLGDWAAAEDATQATFLTLWRRALTHRVESPRTGSELAVLLGIARHQCRTVARSQGRGQRLTTKLGQDPTSSGRVIEPDRLEAEVLMAEINQALTKLSTEQRDVLEMVCWSGLTMAEAAEALSLPLGTVKSRLSRARAALTADGLHELLGGAR